MTAIDAGFAERVHALRREKGLAQWEVADAIGYSDGTIASWERGQKLPGFDAIISIASVYGVNVGYILGVEERVNS